MGLEAMNFFLLLHAVRQGNELNNLGRRLRPELTHNNRVAGQNAAAVLDISDEDNDNDGRYNEDNDDGGGSLVNNITQCLQD